MHIKTHKELATVIENKTILLCCSLGKDSIACLLWLYYYAKPKSIVCVYFARMAKDPDDDRYINYLKGCFPEVSWIVLPNPVEINFILEGIFQDPIKTITEFNKSDYESFSMSDMIEETRQKVGADYICLGNSKYEGFARAVKFHKQGLVQDNKIYPLGMMTKAQVIGAIKNSGVKVHPCYKFYPGTQDHPSYWRMRSQFIANLEFKKNVYKVYPLLELDEWRYKHLFEKGT